MHHIAAAASTTQDGVWAYFAVFALVALSFAGIPGIGAAVIGGAAVLASQGKLNIAAVLIAAAIGAEVGGLLGYEIGQRWGRQIIERPGRSLERRRKAVSKGEELYQKWGRLAVFFTPAMVSGIVRMRYSQFVVWNFLAGAVFVLSIGPCAYGAGKVSSGHHDSVSIGSLVGGLAIGAVCVVLAVRYHRRPKAGRTRRAGEDESPAATGVDTLMSGSPGAVRPRSHRRQQGNQAAARQPAQQPANGTTEERR